MAKYVCARCGKSSTLPDFCCGQSMVPKGHYVCRTCGSTSASPQSCCGQSMTQV